MDDTAEEPPYWLQHVSPPRVSSGQVTHAPSDGSDHVDCPDGEGPDRPSDPRPGAPPPRNERTELRVPWFNTSQRWVIGGVLLLTALLAWTARATMRDGAGHDAPLAATSQPRSMTSAGHASSPPSTPPSLTADATSRGLVSTPPPRRTTTADVTTFGPGIQRSKTRSAPKSTAKSTLTPATSTGAEPQTGAPGTVLLGDARFAGLNWEAARREATTLGLVTHDDWQPVADVPYGIVVAVRPHGLVPVGSEIWIVISRGAV